jgi:hypothetical protein
MNIDIKTLEEASKIIFAHLKEAQVNSVELDQDFYWDVSPEQRYNPYQNPDNLSLGQLSSDWEHIQKIVLETEEPIGYSLVWLASLLKFLGENKSV